MKLYSKICLRSCSWAKNFTGQFGSFSLKFLQKNSIFGKNDMGVCIWYANKSTILGMMPKLTNTLKSVKNLINAHHFSFTSNFSGKPRETIRSVMVLDCYEAFARKCSLQTTRFKQLLNFALQWAIPQSHHCQQIFDQLPYLATVDFFLFPTLKLPLRGTLKLLNNSYVHMETSETEEDQLSICFFIHLTEEAEK